MIIEISTNELARVDYQSLQLDVGPSSYPTSCFWVLFACRHYSLLAGFPSFIYSFNRIQESLLYKKLLATYVIPREKLDKAIVLDER